MGRYTELIDSPNSSFDTQEAIKKSRIDLSKPMPQQPILISSGTDWSGNPRCVLGEGDYSCITGIGNSKKSFFKAALAASYIGGETEFGFTTHRDSRLNKIVIDIDTEQSDHYAQKTFRRVERMVGSRYENYQAYALRKYTYSERFEIVESLVHKYGSQIGLILIDGYSDLVQDTNDNIESMNLIQNLMTWTDKYQFHITGILHENPVGGKIRGHLGSEVSRKASAIFKITADTMDNARSRVDNVKARDEKFTPFEFRIEQGLPKYQGIVIDE